MQPIGLLMKEHRLIERMIPLLEKNLKKSEETQMIYTAFISVVIDFFKTYVDKIHHGKEEDILFKSLKKIQISTTHKKTLNQLLEDHKISRVIIGEIEDANHRYLHGDNSAIHDIQEGLHKIIMLYPCHIEIEDKRFFFPIMDYFTREECDAMIQKFFDFDKNIIHEYYNHIIEIQEKLWDI